MRSSFVITPALVPQLKCSVSLVFRDGDIPKSEKTSEYWCVVSASRALFLQPSLPPLSPLDEHLVIFRAPRLSKRLPLVCVAPPLPHATSPQPSVATSLAASLVRQLTAVFRPLSTTKPRYESQQAQSIINIFGIITRTRSLHHCYFPT